SLTQLIHHRVTETQGKSQARASQARESSERSLRLCVSVVKKLCAVLIGLAVAARRSPCLLSLVGIHFADAATPPHAPGRCATVRATPHARDSSSGRRCDGPLRPPPWRPRNRPPRNPEARLFPARTCRPDRLGPGNIPVRQPVVPRAQLPCSRGQLRHPCRT